MSDSAISGIAFACILGAAFVGMGARAVLPHHHLSSESKDIVKLGTGLIATMAALVLGLLIASARGSYDVRAGEVVQFSTNVILLDRALAHYGPEAAGIRDMLRRAVIRAHDRLWPEGASRREELAPAPAWDEVHDRIQRLAPQTDVQRTRQAEAVAISRAVVQTRWLLAEQDSGSIPRPFLVLLVFWLAVIFTSFGLFSPNNATVIATLFICSLSVAVAIFLILELDQPFDGLIKISASSVRNALAHLGR